MFCWKKVLEKVCKQYLFFLLEAIQKNNQKFFAGYMFYDKNSFFMFSWL